MSRKNDHTWELYIHEDGVYGYRCVMCGNRVTTKLTDPNDAELNPFFSKLICKERQTAAVLEG